jgi:hypothetical protein
MRKRLLREPETRAAPDGAVRRAHFAQKRGIVRGVGDDCDVRMIFGGAAHHRRSADVDVFDRVF